MNNKKLILAVVLVVAAVVAASALVLSQSDSETDEAMSGQENKNLSADISDGWKTFTSKDLNYSIDYPSDWYASSLEGVDDVSADYFSSKDVDSPLDLADSEIWISITAIANENGAPLEAVSGEGAGETDQIISSKKVQVAGFDAVQNDEQMVMEGTSPGYFITTYIDEGDRFLIVQAMSGQESLENYRPTVNKMLDSLSCPE